MTTHDIAKVERTEMYLKSMLVIALGGHRVTTSRVAEAMGVSAPSASEMLKRLEHLGYVEPSPDGVQLTGTGVQIATQVVRRLRLAERLLTDILKMDLDRVYDEACKMEHVISPEVESRLDDVLKHPETCPHGHPIPGPDGAFLPEDGQTLATLTARTPARVTALRLPPGQAGLRRERLVTRRGEPRLRRYFVPRWSAGSTSSSRSRSWAMTRSSSGRTTHPGITTAGTAWPRTPFPAPRPVVSSSPSS